jgi:hypothetical protein
MCIYRWPQKKKKYMFCFDECAYLHLCEWTIVYAHTCTVHSVINQNAAVTSQLIFSTSYNTGELILLFLRSETCLISGKYCSSWWWVMQFLLGARKRQLCSSLSVNALVLSLALLWLGNMCTNVCFVSGHPSYAVIFCYMVRMIECLFFVFSSYNKRNLSVSTWSSFVNRKEMWDCYCWNILWNSYSLKLYDANSDSDKLGCVMDWISLCLLNLQKISNVNFKTSKAYETT